MPEPLDPRTRELADSLAAVRQRLDAAVAAAGRRTGDVDLLVVTKFFPAADVERLISLGARQFGESREPEASRKIDELRACEANRDQRAASEIGSGAVAFDMIGSVQSKKAGSVAGWARAVHSVDREKIVTALGRAAATALAEARRREPLEILIQISLDGDPTRGGATEDEWPAIAELVKESEALRLRGVMAIAPIDGGADRWMAEAARVHQRFLADHPEATTLSTGMSGDLEEAVQHGSTCVRVGTAILGKRPLLSQ
ncbi:YggS family pyridoxal phosphate-dependent enzyme [Gordonia soli]|uniref:Pyridoxal phosphate homeostasis protein n=1 Tax=Gordonia soli NBRC 108243 TaxID=1223545 RepID=M0QNP3_9ACTN|nr:YggS family pyridoxal phosphate-dependent enzyme [Gordonia soli]GAC70029.1 hypothetical protein GS4_30_01010 [Gordonia soli NBRC 108243]